MAAATGTFKQEMPPIGGYRPINFHRTFAKRFMTFPRFVILNLTCSAIWYYQYRHARIRVFLRNMEDRSTNASFEPLLLAERDREYLKQLRKNRDEEAELMKNYPNWVVGSYFGEPVFRTLPDNYLVDPNINEYYIHTRLKYLSEYFHMTQKY